MQVRYLVIRKDGKITKIERSPAGDLTLTLAIDGGGEATVVLTRQDIAQLRPHITEAPKKASPGV